MCVYTLIFVFIYMQGILTGLVSFIASMEMHSWFFTLVVVLFSSDLLNSHEALTIISGTPVYAIVGPFFPVTEMFIMPFAMSKGIHLCLKS